MFGICVAVTATTSAPPRPRQTRLKLWKSRPAAPAISTRVLFMHRAYAATQDSARASGAPAGRVEPVGLEERPARRGSSGGALLTVRPDDLGAAGVLALDLDRP